jgi:hypothetical protein
MLFNLHLNFPNFMFQVSSEKKSSTSIGPLTTADRETWAQVISSQLINPHRPTDRKRPKDRQSERERERERQTDWEGGGRERQRERDGEISINKERE